jgi:hypothetical protein
MRYRIQFIIGIAAGVVSGYYVYTTWLLDLLKGMIC